MLETVLLFLLAFSATPHGDALRLEWVTTQAAGLHGFYVYRQTDTGWAEVRTDLTRKPKQKYRIKDAVPCGSNYTYLLRAYGQVDGQSYFQDWRLNEVQFPCPVHQQRGAPLWQSNPN